MLKPVVMSFLVNYALTPNALLTPGNLCDPSESDFSHRRYSEQIPYCERHVSSSMKRKVYDRYGIPNAERDQYTIDHLVPLAIGGNNAITNLWPEAKELKRAMRPHLEEKLYLMMRDGEISQEEAIECIWQAKYKLEKCSFESEEQEQQP